MTQQIAYLEAVIGADITAFRRGMREVRNDLGVLSDTIGGIGRLGRNMTFAVTAPLVGFGVAAVKAAGDFDAAMRNVNSIAQLSEDQFKALSDQALEFGKTIRAGPQAAAEALYTVFSAGITDPQNAFEVMSVCVKTAEAGLADLNTTVGAVSASVLAYSKVGMTAARASDILTRTVQLGVGEMNNFARALPYVTPAAAAAGIALEDVGAALAYLTQQGTPANTAARQLNQAISNIVKPSDAMTAALQKLGVVGIDGLLKKYGNLKDALLALGSTTDGSVEGMNKLFGNALAGRAVFGLTNDVDRLNKSWAEFMSGIEGATDIARSQQLLSFEAQFDLMTSAAKGLAITIGQILIPAITPLIQGLTNVLNGVTKLDPNLLKVGVAFAAVAAAAGPLLWIFSSLLNPIGLIVGASAALAVAIGADWGNIGSSIETALGKAIPALAGLQQGINDFFTAFFDEGGTAKTPFDFAALMPEVTAEDVPIHIEGTLWDAWKGDLKEQFPNREDFIKLATEALQQQHGLSPYQIPVGGIDLTLGGTGGVHALMPDSVHEALAGMGAQVEQDNSLGARFSRAITAAGPMINQALIGVFNQAKDFVLNTVFPTLDTLGGDLLRRIGRSIFSGTEDTKGKSPVYDGIRSMLNGGISQAAGELGTIVDKHFPSLTAGFSEFIGRIGQWLIDEGIPTVSRSVGYFIGRVGATIGEGIANIPQLLFGGGKTDQPGMVQGIKNTVISPFQEGFSEAMKDTGIQDRGDAFITSIVGWIGAIIMAKLALALVTQGVVATFGNVVGGAFGAAKIGVTGAGTTLAGSIGTFLNSALGSIAGTLGISMGTLLGGALAIALVAGYVLNEDVRNQINALGEGIADTLFGQGFTDRARQTIQTALTPVLEPIMRGLINVENFNKENANATSLPEGVSALDIFTGRYADQQKQQQLAATQQYGMGDSPYRFNPLINSDMHGGAYDMSRDYSASTFTPAAASAAAAGEAAAVGPVSNPIQGLIDALLPDAPAGSAISNFVAEGLTLWDTYNTGQTDKTNLASAGLAAFAISATNHLNPVKILMDQMLAAWDALAGAMAMGGVADATGATPVAQHAIGGAVHPGLFGMNREEIFKANVGGSVIPASMVRGMGEGGGGNTQTINNITIHEVPDVQSILFEFKRMGINLDGRTS